MVRADMPELPANTSYLQYKGVFDMQDLYEFLYSFFSRNKFKFYETKLIHKRPGPVGPEVHHYWQAKRDVEEYYQFVIDILVRTFDMQELEVTMKDGSKRIFMKGRIWIQFRGKVVMDYEKRWDEKAFYAHLKNFYHKYVIWKKILGLYWDNMYYNVFLKLQSLVKERLKMEADAYEHRYFHKMR